MTNQELGSLVGAVLEIGGFIPYLITTVQGDTKPSKASWWIWVSLDCLTLIGMLLKKTANGQLVGGVIGGSFVIGVAHKYGKSKWEPRDIFCLIGGAIGIAFWVFTQDPQYAIVISLVVVTLGAIPTFQDAWIDPFQENLLAWTLFFCASAPILLSLPVFTVASAAQPITWALINGTMMVIIAFRRWQISRTKRSLRAKQD